MLSILGLLLGHPEIEDSKMLDQEVCAENEIKEGEMKQVQFGSGKILLTKYQNKISAVSGKCTHYGAPLISGAYKDGKVRCPWHGACFSTVTGDIEDFPGLDSLHKYEVVIKNGMVIVKGYEETLKDFRRIKDMGHSCPLKEIILVIGGGGSAMTFCETLRQEGYKGRVIIATQENHVPYDRPKLSKMLNTEASKLYLRTPEFLKERNIEIMYNKKATSVNTQSKEVQFEDGTVQTYKKLYVATGGKPRLLTLPGSDLENIFYLRSPEDANTIDASCPDKNVVILGTGFIALELASYFVSKSKSVTVVGSGRSKLPFEKLLGEPVAKMYYQQHTEKGVKFSLDQPAKEIRGENGKVSGVVLASGKVLVADVVIVGIGVTPSTEFLKNSQGVTLTSQGFIEVDKYMNASKDVYAGGDVVAFPYCHDKDEMINIGHWQLASYHGRCAALNVIGKVTPCETVPFFWTGQYGKSLRYSGHCTDFDDIVYEGNVDEMKFAAYYFKNGKMKAVACMNMGAKASEIAFSLKNNCTLSIEELRKKIDTERNPEN